MIRTTDTVDVRIRRASMTDRSAVAAIVAAAFFDDPIVRQV